MMRHGSQRLWPITARTPPRHRQPHEPVWRTKAAAAQLMQAEQQLQAYSAGSRMLAVSTVGSAARKAALDLDEPSLATAQTALER